MFALAAACDSVVLHSLCAEQVLLNGAVLIVLEIGTYLKRGGADVS